LAASLRCWPIGHGRK